MLIVSAMYNKCNNEHYDIDISDKLIFCKDRSAGYNLKENGTQDLVPNNNNNNVKNVLFSSY